MKISAATLAVALILGGFVAFTELMTTLTRYWNRMEMMP